MQAAASAEDSYRATLQNNFDVYAMMAREKKFRYIHDDHDIGHAHTQSAYAAIMLFACAHVLIAVNNARVGTASSFR